jgi:BirA family biotin operon repressor/biotin-[acetyl-CoA-carboxylase] ligase
LNRCRQLTARPHGKQWPEGLIIVAGEQTAGRGRLDRKWISPAGAGLYFSIVLRPAIDVRAWSLLPLMAALAVHDALWESCGLETDIKWPNDIMVDGRKLCGILAETIETDLGRAVIVGIGINLKPEAFPIELRGVAISVQDAVRSAPDSETVLAALTRALVVRYHSFLEADGQASIKEEWTRRSSYAWGRRVQVAGVSEVFTGTTRGLESDGALRVETDTGQMRIVRAGDVTSLRPQRDN